jgi:GT2 family glycosyltransferase
MQIEIDVVIISYAKNLEFKKVTEDCVFSLLSSEEKINFNIFIIESNKDEKFLKFNNFKNIKIIYPASSFGYNKYLNVGISLGKSEFICLCNNDLIFKKGWASAMLNAMELDKSLLSASPYSTNPHKTKFKLDICSKIEYGYSIRRYLAGWCIFQKRKIYDIIGPLDEQFIFWYADNDYSKTLKKNNLNHALVLNSVVEHIESKTLNSENLDSKKKFTKDQLKIFEKKWKK